MIGPARDSSRVSPVGLFRRHYLLLREVSVTGVVLVRARVRGDQIPSLPIAVGLLQSVQLQGVLIAVHLTIGLESAPGEGDERLYQLPLHLDQFQQCPLSLVMVVRTRVVGTADRVPEAELGEAG